jgi:hypothetical protein
MLKKPHDVSVQNCCSLNRFSFLTKGITMHLYTSQLYHEVMTNNSILPHFASMKREKFQNKNSG